MKAFNNKGFSLIELMVALVILAIGILAVASLQTTAIRGNLHGNTISQATALAEERIEEIRNLDYGDIFFAEPTEPGLDGTIYTRTTLVEEDAAVNIKRITVTVSWNANGPHQVVLRTIVTDGG